MPISHYKWHPYTRRRYVFASCALIFGIIVWIAAREPSDWLFLIGFFVVVALLLLVEQDTSVDVHSGLVIREGHLFGRLLVWRWRARLKDFTGVAFRRQQDPEGDDTVFVGLRRRSGRLMAIQYFFVRKDHPCYEAERVARSLAEATGLNIYPEGN